MLFFKVREFVITELKSGCESSSEDETRIRAMEVDTTIDDVSLRGKTRKFSLQSKYSKFLSRENGRYGGIDPECARAFPLSGSTTNLLAFEFLQNDRIEPVYDEEFFTNEQELSTFLQNIHQTYSISLENNGIEKSMSANTGEHWRLLARSLYPDLNNVCFYCSVFDI